MQIDGVQIINAPREAVWRALNDETMLKASIPGCKSLVRESGTAMKGSVTIRIGVVSATFNGVVTLSDMVAPSCYTINGESSGGIAGFARGRCTVRLVEAGVDVTQLHYTAKSEVGGKLASIGARLLEGTARKIIAQFFDAFAGQVDEGVKAGAAG
jgi:hypothetical protein